MRRGLRKARRTMAAVPLLMEQQRAVGEANGAAVCRRGAFPSLYNLFNPPGPSPHNPSTNPLTNKSTG